ncbi:hypothetical protein [Kribbella sp. CA-293567]|uniref:hypothetical protein n=1 Tax=Kribbella sp. CA-293567 TaxID=3002436 RepID=UPI0022DDECEB|nr:hypothetical protein [Kribbella sp. CA-293567]WBQ02610.1 hypothetical protein OX958_21780 [Kribbella sp. CA-293567]
MRFKARRMMAATAIAVLGISGLSAQTASADPPCYAGEVCVYYQGSLVSKFAPVSSGSCRYLSHSYDRLWNRSSFNQRAWSGTNCSGRNQLVVPYENANINYFWSVGGY